MGWRFRRSFKVIPGVRLNLSRHGLSASIGGAPLTLNVGPQGVYGTASVPGAGISFRQKLGGVPGAQHLPNACIPSDMVEPGQILPLPGSVPSHHPQPIPDVVPSTAPVEERGH